MRLQKLGSLSLTGLLLLILSGCQTTMKPTPYILAVKSGQCGEYSIVKDNPITFAFKVWHPIADCDGFFAIPADQAAEALREYRVYQATHP